MATLYHQVQINASPAKIFAAISTKNGIGSWWDQPTFVKSNNKTVLEFRPGPAHGVLKMELQLQIKNKRIMWKCISSHEPESPASAWTGTRIKFEITGDDHASILDFCHLGWDEANKYFGFCNFQWGLALQKLKKYCEN